MLQLLRLLAYETPDPGKVFRYSHRSVANIPDSLQRLSERHNEGGSEGIYRALVALS
jgi:hypothetical protein